MAAKVAGIQGIGSAIAENLSIKDSAANYLGVESIVLVAVANLLEEISIEDSNS